MSKQENLWMITGEETGGSRGNTGFTGGLLGSDPQDEQSAIKGNKSSVSSSKLKENLHNFMETVGEIFLTTRTKNEGRGQTLAEKEKDCRKCAVKNQNRDGKSSSPYSHAS